MVGLAHLMTQANYVLRSEYVSFRGLEPSYLLVGDVKPKTLRIGPVFRLTPHLVMICQKVQKWQQFFC